MAATDLLDAGVIFRTDKCSVRVFRPADAEPMAALANDPEVTKTLRDRFPRPYTPDVARAWIARCLADDPVMHFAVCAPDGSFAGASATPANTDAVYARTRELGYWLGRRYWGRGLAGSAARGFSRWAFGALPALLRVEAWVVGGNGASEGALRRAGFAREGVRRCAVCKGGRVLDEVVYGLTRGDVEGEEGEGEGEGEGGKEEESEAV